MIQFACPSCSSTCSVDDKYAGRKLKCPKCGARVVHVKDREVRLLTAGTAPAPKPASASQEATQPLSDVTPIATHVPHSVTELISTSESKQNFYIGAGLLLFFSIVAIILGIALGVRLLIFTPIAIDLTAVGIYLWLHTQKIKKRIVKKPPA